MSSIRERFQARRKQVNKLIAEVTEKVLHIPKRPMSVAKETEKNELSSSNNTVEPDAKRLKSDRSSLLSPDTESPENDPKSSKTEEAKNNLSETLPLPSTSVDEAILSEEYNVHELLTAPSAKERENRKITSEINELLNKPTAKELALMEKFKSDGTQVQEFCPQGTKEECRKVSAGRACQRLHFRKIIQKHTDISLGDCSFLNTFFHMDSCKYIHYEVDYGTSKTKLKQRQSSGSSGGDKQAITESGHLLGIIDTPTVLYPPQWIQCDMRLFDLSVLGKFSVVMADPPWDIHMELPYGTMSDDEMKKLNIQCLQDKGLIFLWVTGRAMELGRDCLRIWGYDMVDEIIWVKTNQLQRIIRTGRTGHWLNHGKEHCLIGLKGPTDKFYTGLDCDVIVAEVRATSHKPDEIYGLIERLSPGTRKIELFGRAHNVQHNWITLGNQLDGVRMLDPEVVSRVLERYPDGKCMPTPQEVQLYKEQKLQRR